MVLPLRYGEPPKKSECKDLGTMKVDVAVAPGEKPDSTVGGLSGYNDYVGGFLKSDWVLARDAVAELRGEYSSPVKVYIEGLGTLLYGESGWEVV